MCKVLLPHCQVTLIRPSTGQPLGGGQEAPLSPPQICPPLAGPASPLDAGPHLPQSLAGAFAREVLIWGRGSSPSPKSRLLGQRPARKPPGIATGQEAGGGHFPDTHPTQSCLAGGGGMMTTTGLSLATAEEPQSCATSAPPSPQSTCCPSREGGSLPSFSQRCWPVACRASGVENPPHTLQLSAQQDPHSCWERGGALGRLRALLQRKRLPAASLLGRRGSKAGGARRSRGEPLWQGPRTVAGKGHLSKPSKETDAQKTSRHAKPEHIRQILTPSLPNATRPVRGQVPECSPSLGQGDQNTGR